MGSDGTLCIVQCVCIGRAFAQGVESVDSIGVGASRGFEERLRAGCQLTFGCRRRIHVGGVELCNALRFVGSGNIDGVDGRRALAASRREGLVRGHAGACRFVGNDASLVDELAHEFKVGGGLSYR